MLLTLLLLVCTRVVSLECQETAQEPVSVRPAARSLLVSYLKVTPVEKDQIFDRLENKNDPIHGLIYPYSECWHYNGHYYLRHDVYSLRSFESLTGLSARFVTRCLLDFVMEMITANFNQYVDMGNANAILFNHLTGKMRLTGLGLSSNNSYGHGDNIEKYLRSVFPNYDKGFSADLFEKLVDKQKKKEGFERALREMIGKLEKAINPIFFIKVKDIVGKADFYKDATSKVSVKFEADKDAKTTVTLKTEQHTQVYHLLKQDLPYHVFLCYKHAQCVEIDQLTAFTGWLPAPADKADMYKMNFKMERLTSLQGSHFALYAIVVPVKADVMKAIASGGKATIDVNVDLSITTDRPTWGVCFNQSDRFSFGRSTWANKRILSGESVDKISSATLRVGDRQFHQLDIDAFMQNTNEGLCGEFDQDYRVFEDFVLEGLEQTQEFIATAFDKSTNELRFLHLKFLPVKEYAVMGVADKSFVKGLKVYVDEHEVVVNVVENNAAKWEHSLTFLHNRIQVKNANAQVQPQYVARDKKIDDQPTMFFDLSQHKECFLTVNETEDDPVVQVHDFPCTPFAVLVSESQNQAQLRSMYHLLLTVTDGRVASALVCMRDAASALHCRSLRDGIKLSAAKNDFVVEPPAGWTARKQLSLHNDRAFFFFDGKLMVKRFELKLSLPVKTMLDCRLSAQFVEAENRLSLSCNNDKAVKETEKSADAGKTLGELYDYCERMSVPSSDSALKTICAAPQKQKRTV